METVLIKCPHCKEQMQAPTGRESILCMFCGEKIDLRETDVIQPDVETDLKKPAGKAKDAGKCYENLNFVLEHAGAACRDYSAKVRAFRKDSYHELFERYKEENYAFYTAEQQQQPPYGNLQLFPAHRFHRRIYQRAKQV